MTNFKNIKVILLSLVLTLFSLNVKAQNSYISNNKILANALSQEFGIPSSVILAIAFVESGGGTSKNSKAFNNHFGIVGKNNVNGSKYKSFASAEASFRGFCEMIARKKYYSKLKGSVNHTQWLSAISSAGYSTQPKEWLRRVNLIINKFNL